MASGAGKALPLLAGIMSCCFDIQVSPLYELEKHFSKPCLGGRPESSDASSLLTRQGRIKKKLSPITGCSHKHKAARGHLTQKYILTAINSLHNILKQHSPKIIMTCCLFLLGFNTHLFFFLYISAANLKRKYLFCCDVCLRFARVRSGTFKIYVCYTYLQAGQGFIANA